MHELPAAAAEQAGAVEAALIEHARPLNPDQLGRAARRLVACLDPDGSRPDDATTTGAGDVTLTRCRTAPAGLHGELTPAATAVTRPGWTRWPPRCPPPTASRTGAPPGSGGTTRCEDIGRPAAARRCAARLRRHPGHRAGHPHPRPAGVPARCRDHRHGGPISVPQALRMAGEADIMPVVLSDTGGVLGYGADPADRLHRATSGTGRPRRRLFVPGLRPAPGLVRRPTTSSRGIDGGPTDLDNLTLVCGFHHREFAKRGWACHITDGVPHWIPPAWLDRDQRPRRNTAHDIDLA